MVTNEKLYTVDAFEAFQDDYPDRRFELIDERIVEEITSERHGAIAANIGAALQAWKKQGNQKGYYSLNPQFACQTMTKIIASLMLLLG